MKSVYIAAGMLLFLPAVCSPPFNSLSQGEHLFQVYCASCHGSKGEGGRGPTLAVAKLRRAPTERLLVGVIRDGIRGTEMPRFELNQGEIRQIARWVRGLGEGSNEGIVGNAGRGEQVYFNKGRCAECHAIKGRGGVSGPDLTAIGLARSAVYLRNALTDPELNVPGSLSSVSPDARISANFLQVRLITRHRERIAGLRINEDTFSIQIRDLSGRIRSFYKAELLDLHKDWGKSPMPSYGDVLSNTELNDLVAFLASLRDEK
jgi:putative heme-binding domain-containing protein